MVTDYQIRGKVEVCVCVWLGVVMRRGGAVSGSVEGLFMDPHREPLVLVFVTFTHTLLNRWPII